MTSICPHCGYSLEADRPIALDGFEIDPRGKIAWHGALIRLSEQQAEILHAIAVEKGRPVKIAVLAERLGYEGDGNLVDVQICRLRRTLAAVGAPDVIRATGARGFFWASPTQ